MIKQQKRKSRIFDDISPFISFKTVLHRLFVFVLPKIKMEGGYLYLLLNFINKFGKEPEEIEYEIENLIFT